MFRIRRNQVNIYDLFPPQVGDHFPISQYFDDGHYDPTLVDFCSLVPFIECEHGYYIPVLIDFFNYGYQSTLQH